MAADELDFSEELIQLSGTIQGEIISRMIKEGQRVTGKTIDSITVDNRPTGFTIWSAPYIMALDTGRGPSKGGPAGDPPLKELILEWIKNKGIVPKATRKDGVVMDYNYRGLAFAITRRIHEQGNLIFRLQKPTGIITGVITEERIDAFIGTFSRKFMDFVRSEILESIKRN